MAFCTVINCMDGRVQLPVLTYLQNRFAVRFVDNITAAGPIRLLAEDQDCQETRDLLDRVEISLTKHNSCGIAVVAHFDCAGNPIPKEEQLQQVYRSVNNLRRSFSGIEILGLWVDENWQVSEVISKTAL